MTTPLPAQLESLSTHQTALDAAYHTKYRRYAASTIDHIVSPEARAATVKLVPRATGS